MRRRRGALAYAFGVAVLVLAAMRGGVRRYVIAERSMSPTLSPGDWTLAKRTGKRPRRGSIVVFPIPGPKDIEVVKRVVGLPGETVAIAKGQVHIDGDVLAEPWADGPTRPDGQWELGSSQIFVLGDGRALSSSDSRTFGPIDVAAARWRITGCYWPPQSFGTV